MNFLFSNQESLFPIKPYPATTSSSLCHSPKLSPLNDLIIPQNGLGDQSSSASEGKGAKQYKKGKWTKGQQIAYINFIRDNKSEMQTKLMRKSRKVFLQMSKLVKTRNADQCRSHHQKILIYHHNLQEIIRFYTQGEGSFDFQRRHKQVKRQPRTTIDEPSRTILQNRLPFTMQWNGSHIKIIVQDCLIQAFNIC